MDRHGTPRHEAGCALSDLFEILLANAVIIAAAMVGLWVLSLVIRDAGIVDIFWGLGFVLIAGTTFLLAEGTGARKVLLVSLTAIWGLRLAAYLAWRNLGKGEDYRYRAMRRHWGSRYGLVSLATVFMLQGGLMLVVSLPVQVGQIPASPSSLIWLDYAGILLFGAGFIFETTGDLQLARFKAKDENEGKVMNRGLWRYTRHPNYFGDFLVWWGLYAIALATGQAWWSIIGPLVMSVLLWRVSGVALLEKTITGRRPGYAEYMRTTSAFFPRRPQP